MKKSIKEPIREIDAEQRNIFGKTNNSIIIVDSKEVLSTVDKLINLRISGFVLAQNSSIIDYLDLYSNYKNMSFWGLEDFKKLMKKSSYYYISGYLVIEYKGTPREIYSTLTYVLNNLSLKKEMKIIHLIESNIYFDWAGKSFTDIVEGPVLSHLS